MSTPPPHGRRRSVTALRLGGAFAAVLALFGAALVVTLGALNRIAQAEHEVATLDHAKHAGHYAASQVREQYRHQAHLIIRWSTSHLDHYDGVAAQTRKDMEHLRTLAATPDEQALVAEIARLAEESDREFRENILPAIEGDDREAVGRLHDRLIATVERVVKVNEELNARFEARSATARARAEALRSRARVVTLACFALAILLAGAVGALLSRSILKPIRALRAGAERVGEGDLDARIQVAGSGEFAELAAAFNQMTADLARHQAQLLRSQKLASIGQVAAGVAHEINNPLGVMLGYVKLMRRDPAHRDSEELGIIEQETLQCQRIVQGLLDLARPMRLDLAPVDLTELARDSVARLDDAGKLDGVKVELPEGGGAVARADEAKLRQVVLNLLVNAAEAAATGGHTVTIGSSTAAGHATLEIADTGPGIAPDVLGRVFDPFFTTKEKGTGLGLSIAQAIVEAHGGRIDIDSTPGRGTRVALRLPAAEAVKEARS